MLFLFFVYLLSARALPVPAVDKANTPSSCKDIDNHRTLLGIIWSCVTTVFLCTWVAVHPNIPEPVDTQEMDFWHMCLQKTSRFFKYKVAMFICALLVPEYVLAWAIKQRWMARKIAKNNVDLKLTRTHAFFVIMGGFHYFEGSDEAGASYNAVHPLTYQDAISMLKNGTISLPSKKEIQDKSKSDWLAKTIALLQTLWFVMQCIARITEKLPTTELEIVTLAYTAVNIGMFIAWWDKPRNVECPIRVFQKPMEKDEGNPQHWWANFFMVIYGNQDYCVDLHRRTKVPILDLGMPTEREFWTADGITLVADLVFGAIHCIAWSFKFRSHTELLLWSLSSITITAVPTLFGSSLLQAYLADSVILSPLLRLLYIMARLTTIVLACMSLSSLPSGAFQAVHSVHWTTLIPHL